MKAWIRYTLTSVCCLLCVAAVVVVYREVKKERSGFVCRSVQVNVIGEEKFLQEDEVKKMIYRNYGAYIGQPLDSIRLDKMKKIMNYHHFVVHSEAWMTKDCVLHLEVLQKSPLLRFENDGNGFYIDKDGIQFPLHDSWTADVPVVSGPIQSKEWADSVLVLFSKCDVREIIEDESGSIILHTQRGDEDILFGRPENIDEKVKLINTYYDRIVPERGKYTSVNIKYKGKIYCKI